ncbi:MAG TPA: DUF4340 domain-containing protein [Thermoanaerobaculia bacterium]|jgi:hypothetical protein
MNARTLLVLTVLAAVLGAFIYFVERDLPTTDERREQEKKVLSLEQDDVTAVEIAWDEETVRLEREDPPAAEEEGEGEEDDAFFARPQPEWNLVAPRRARADRNLVDDLLRDLTALEKERTEVGVDRAEAGLDAPRARVTLVTAGAETVLEVGAELPASSDMLIAVAGRDEVYQVASSVWTDLTREAGDWRDKKLFTATRADVDRVRLTSGGAEVLLAERGDVFWIESPITDLADEEHVNGLLNEITGLTASRFLDDPERTPVELGLEPPAHVLEVVLEGREEPYRLALGEPEEEEEGEAQEGAARTVHARAGEQLVELSTRLVDAFRRPPEAWRSRAWTPIQVYRVESARFADAGGEVEVTREEGDWLRGEDRVDYSAVSDLLYAVADADADEVVSRDEAAARGHALEKPAIEVTLVMEDAEESLALYPTVDGLAAATREGRDAVLLLPSSAVEEVTAKLAALRAAEPLADEEEEGEEPEEGEAAEEPD